jgi:cytochrome c oxidase subunit II
MAKMKNYILILGIISMFLVNACAQSTEPQSDIIEPSGRSIVQAETPIPGQEDGVETIVVPSEDTEPKFIEIDMTTWQWDWDPRTITVDEGDNVKLNIKNLDVQHGFALFEFGVNEKLTGNGAVTSVEFTADKAGEYTFFCSVPCGKGHSGMKGTLVVE